MKQIMINLPFVRKDAKKVPESKHQELDAWLKSARIFSHRRSSPEDRQIEIIIKRRLSSLDAVEYFAQEIDYGATGIIQVHYKTAKDVESGNATLSRNSTTKIHEHNLREVEFLRPQNSYAKSFIAGWKAAEKRAIEGQPITAMELTTLAKNHADNKKDKDLVGEAKIRALKKETAPVIGRSSRVWIITESDYEGEDPFGPQRYWNEAAGWVEQKSKATKYSIAQQKKKSLPVNGQWTRAFSRKS